MRASESAKAKEPAGMPAVRKPMAKANGNVTSEEVSYIEGKD